MPPGLPARAQEGHPRDAGEVVPALAFLPGDCVNLRRMTVCDLISLPGKIGTMIYLKNRALKIK